MSSPTDVRKSLISLNGRKWNQKERKQGMKRGEMLELLQTEKKKLYLFVDSINLAEMVSGTFDSFDVFVHSSVAAHLHQAARRRAVGVRGVDVRTFERQQVHETVLAALHRIVQRSRTDRVAQRDGRAVLRQWEHRWWWWWCVMWCDVMWWNGMCVWMNEWMKEGRKEIESKSENENENEWITW